MLLILLICSLFVVAEENAKKTAPESSQITSPTKADIIPAFDLIHARVQKKGICSFFNLVSRKN